ncbi:MAG: alpha/beta hydrolase [Methanoregula sp.]|nr:alpha/beta hydrolase [Methanoregula sp.]
MRIGAIAGMVGCLLLLSAFLAGCTGTPAKSSFTVDENGILSIAAAPPTISEQVLFSNETYTKAKIVMQTGNGDVVTYLSTPPTPKAAIVYAPGAGERLAGHEERMVRFAAAGYAFLFVDTRGNGGETPGFPFNPGLDFNAFGNGNWPEYYETVCDLSQARQILNDRLHVPVYAMGSSNGGRYAAVAAGTDRNFAGYVGISTSDWGILDATLQQGYTGDPLRFATSLEPGTYIREISPRPVWMFHAKSDPIIPFESGRDLFSRAGEPKTFLEFSGDHGINPDVDAEIIGQWAQIYGPRG